MLFQNAELEDQGIVMFLKMIPVLCYLANFSESHEPCREKTCLQGLRPACSATETG